jgi:hypothetical protein
VRHQVRVANLPEAGQHRFLYLRVLRQHCAEFLNRRLTQAKARGHDGSSLASSWCIRARKAANSAK